MLLDGCKEMEVTGHQIGTIGTVAHNLQAVEALSKKSGLQHESGVSIHWPSTQPCCDELRALTS